MLSILIPTYNYNVLELVYELQFQATREHIDFEILVFDDASTDLTIVSKNQQVSLIDNCYYKLLQENVGRSKIRNLLAKKAKYHWLLFLDADTMPTSKNFICQYLLYLDNEEKIVCGGLEYQNQKPPAEKMLRWVYGRKREAIPVYVRENAPYTSLLTANLAISKSIFNKIAFNETITRYGYEDLVFSYNLSQLHIKVQHIDNTIYHLGLEPSEVFIQKFESSLTVYKYLVSNNIIPENYMKLGRIYLAVKRFGLQKAVAWLFNFFKKGIVRNLTGSKPSVRLFDVYRLGYLCASGE
jgi:glycosyltransferase involved in cell wall biosynthesis